MMPFDVPTRLDTLTTRFPSAQSIKSVAVDGSERTRNAIARLWLSEGVPFSFKDNPGVYDAIRCWLALRLEVNPKDVNLQGSTRIGQSLAPNKFGQEVNEASDLDLFVVSEDLFGRTKDEYLNWSSDFEKNRVKPRNDREARFWMDNHKRVPKTLERGFIDPHLIPLLEKYPLAIKIIDGTDMLVKKMSVTPGAFQPSKASIRVYEDWNAFVRQAAINLKSVEGQ